MGTKKNSNEKEKILQFKPKTIEEYVDCILTVYNGILQLSPKEVDLAKELLVNYYKFVQDNVPDDYITKLLFSTEEVKKIKKKLEWSSFSFSDYKARLRKKGFLIENGDEVTINPKITPSEKIVFNFDLSEL